MLLHSASRGSGISRYIKVQRSYHAESAACVMIRRDASLLTLLSMLLLLLMGLLRLLRYFQDAHGPPCLCDAERQLVIRPSQQQRCARPLTSIKSPITKPHPSRGALHSFGSRSSKVSPNMRKCANKLCKFQIRSAEPSQVGAYAHSDALPSLDAGCPGNARGTDAQRFGGIECRDAQQSLGMQVRTPVPILWGTSSRLQ